jgi:hypothetical protein
VEPHRLHRVITHSPLGYAYGGRRTGWPHIDSAIACHDSDTELSSRRRLRRSGLTSPAPVAASPQWYRGDAMGDRQLLPHRARLAGRRSCGAGRASPGRGSKEASAIEVCGIRRARSPGEPGRF